MYKGEEDAIEIYTPERPYTIYTQSSAEKRLWMNKLRDTIYHYLLKENKCERSSSCSTGKYAIQALALLFVCLYARMYVHALYVCMYVCMYVCTYTNL